LSLTYQSKILKTPKPRFLTQILDYVKAQTTKYCSKGKVEELTQILSTKNVGLLLAERVINLPSEIVPSMHTELPDDLEFTKQQDDIKDPAEFNYQYLLVISRFTVPIDKPTKMQIQKDGMASEAAMSIKRQRLDTSAEKRFYKWEDSVLWPASTVSFSYLTTFREVDDEGNKISV
jgi:hypothetical protein